MSRWKKGYAIEHMPEVWINFLISVARGVGIRLSAGMRSSAWSLMDGCGTGGILGVCSDLDQKRAFFWSKSELETPETPETLETPETPETLETLLVMWSLGCVGGIVVAGELVAVDLVGRFFWRIR